MNVRAAVQKMEAELALAEAALFKCAATLRSGGVTLALTDARAQATTSGCVFQLFLRATTHARVMRLNNTLGSRQVRCQQSLELRVEVRVVLTE